MLRVRARFKPLFQSFACLRRFEKKKTGWLEKRLTGWQTSAYSKTAAKSYCFPMPFFRKKAAVSPHPTPRQRLSPYDKVPLLDCGSACSSAG